MLQRAIRLFDEKNQYENNNFVRSHARAAWYKLQADKGFLLLNYARQLAKKRTSAHNELLNVARIKTMMSRSASPPSLRRSSPARPPSPSGPATKQKLLSILPDYPSLDTKDVLGSPASPVDISSDDDMNPEETEVAHILPSLMEGSPARCNDQNKGTMQKLRKVRDKKRCGKFCRGKKAMKRNKFKKGTSVFKEKGTTLWNQRNEETDTILTDNLGISPKPATVFVVGMQQRGLQIYHIRNQPKEVLGQMQGKLLPHAYTMASMFVAGATPEHLKKVKPLLLKMR